MHGVLNLIRIKGNHRLESVRLATGTLSSNSDIKEEKIIEINV
jgi:hypothetical protein